MRSLRPALCIAAMASAPGCAAPFTYSSPQPVLESVAVPVGYREPGKPWAFAGIEALCQPILQGGTRQRLAFSVAGTVGLCFRTPTTGSHTSPVNPGVHFDEPCVRGVVGGFRGSAHRLLFQVYVGAIAGILGAEQAVGVLQVEGASMLASATVTPVSFSTLPAGTLIGGTLRWDVDGAWLGFAQAAPHFERAGYLLTFAFQQTCNPDAHYQLALMGLTLDGSALAVPAVQFEPFREVLPKVD